MNEVKRGPVDCANNVMRAEANSFSFTSAEESMVGINAQHPMLWTKAEFQVRLFQVQQICRSDLGLKKWVEM